MYIVANYSDVFNQDAVASVRQWATQREVGRDLGIPKSVKVLVDSIAVVSSGSMS